MKNLLLRNARIECLTLPTRSIAAICGSFVKRNASTTPSRLSAAAVPTPHAQQVESLGSATSPLAVLPLSSVLRSFVVMSMSSSPLLLTPATKVLKAIVHSKSGLLNVDRNPILNWVLKQTFYAQFCAGENKKEVSQSIADLHKIGYAGCVLEYAYEVLQDGADKSTEAIEADIALWKNGLLDTVDMVNDGDFIAFK